MLNCIILATHFVTLLVMIAVCRASKGIAGNPLVVAVSALGLPVFGLLVLAMLDFGNHAGNGTTGAWYVIFSVTTLGAVPALTHLGAAGSGVFAAKMLDLHRRRRVRASVVAGRIGT